MQMVIREYAGPGAQALFALLETRTADVDALMRSVPGLVSYTIATTAEGGVAVTVCRDQEGVEESTRRAKEWVAQHAADLGVAAPRITAATAMLHIAA